MYAKGQHLASMRRETFNLACIPCCMMPFSPDPFHPTAKALKVNAVVQVFNILLTVFYANTNSQDQTAMYLNEINQTTHEVNESKEDQ